MKIGASYYPELSSRKQWEADLEKGREIGLKVLRCGEFAWEFIEPADGEFRFDWIHDFLALAAEMGYSVIWCTPSAAPPPRFFRLWPDLTALDFEGKAMSVGHRRNYTPAHPAYRQRCAEMALRLARELKDEPAIVGWQVDNELAGDGFCCWGGSRTAEAFQAYLKKKFVSLEDFNRRVCGGIWSKAYRAWEDIPIPGTVRLNSFHPELRLEFQRYHSTVWQEFYHCQYIALKNGGVTQPVTTNLYDLTWDTPFDLQEWQPEFDVVGIGNYMEGELENQFQFALLRGIAGARKLWVMEQKAGQQRDQNLHPDNPVERLTSHLRRCKEAGAEYSVYWHLRQHCHGCEMEHGAVLNHDGRIGRIGRAVQQAIKAVENVVKIPQRKDLGLLFDFHQQWAQKRRNTHMNWDYRLILQENYFAALRTVCGEPRIIGCNDLDDAKLNAIVVPHFQLDLGITRKLMACAERGATVILTADYARFDDCGAVRPVALLEALMPMLPVPDLELIRLAENTGLTAEDGSAGSIFFALPFGQIEVKNETEPSHLEFPYGKGRVVILLSLFDTTSLERLLKTLGISTIHS